MPPALARKDRAIVVGIGSYPDFGPNGKSANDLPGAAADAVAIGDWLLGRGVEVTQILSTGTPGEPWTVEDRRPRSNDVEQAFRPMVMNGGAEIAARLYVYMAGHGVAPEPRSRCLILADAAGTDWVPNLEAPAWIDWFANQYHFDELVLWMDCCGGQSFNYDRGLPPLPKTKARAGDPAKVFMAFGSGVGREAYEGRIGPGGAVRGLFTDRLLRGLNGAAANAMGEVRSGSLASFLYNGSASTGADPRPKEGPQPMIPQADDMLFATTPLPTYSLGARAADGSPLANGTDVELQDGKFQKIGSVKVANGRIDLPLAVGIYKVVGPGFSRIFEIGADTPTVIP